MKQFDVDLKKEFTSRYQPQLEETSYLKLIWGVFQLQMM